MISHCLIGMFVMSHVLAESTSSTNLSHKHVSYTRIIFGDWEDVWLVRLMVNIAGYATIILPALLCVWYIKKTNYIERAGVGCWPNFLRLFIYGSETDKLTQDEVGTKSKSDAQDLPLSRQAALLFVCFAGLQISYLIWGIIQERIMTVPYGSGSNEEFFKNSQFLVFMNRILAFVFAMCAIFLKRQPKHTVPLYKYSFASMSNILSSWFQYEALKYISFPTQVLAKASKIIPVMIMGKFVSKKVFQTYEYITAAMISLGVSLFLITSSDTTKDHNTVTTFSGIILLAGYIIFDSFTSNWQSELFNKYKMSPVQMMAGVNLFSCIFTVTAMLESGGIIESLSFMSRHSLFIFHIIFLSVCSAGGQLFIFFTISQFGPVVFVTIMTMRLGFAIMLSCIIYHHPVTIVGIFGVFIVFLALFVKIYAAQRLKAIENANKAKSSEISPA